MSRGDAHRGRRGALAGARLQEIELAALDGELDVLHVAEMPLEPLLRSRAAPSYASGSRVAISSMRERRANAGDDVLALRVDEKLAVELPFAGRRVARERDAGARVVAEVAEHHRHDVHAGAERLGDAVHACGSRRAFLSVHDRHTASIAPHSCIVGIHREVVARASRGRAPCTPRRDCAARPRRARRRSATPAVMRLAASRCSNCAKRHAEHDVAVHLDEAAIRVVGEARVAARAREPDDRAIVEAEVEDRLHHAGHRHRRARAHGDEQRDSSDRRIACPVTSSRRRERCRRLRRAARRAPCRSRRYVDADRAGDRESRRHGHAEVRHLGEVGALAAEDGLHVLRAFGGCRRRRSRRTLAMRVRRAAVDVSSRTRSEACRVGRAAASG